MNATQSIYPANPHFSETIGIQAAPPVNGVFQSGSFHQKAVNEFFGIDATNSTAVSAAEKRLACYPTHNALIQALGEQAIHTAMIAVDNTYSGRVKSAIEAMRGTDGSNYRIVGKIAIAVDQYLLLPPGSREDDITQVMSQLPALVQAEGAIEENGWEALEHHDTVASAQLVAAQAGMVAGKDGTPKLTAAIASDLAGRKAGLHVGRKLSTEGNATTFWLITDQSTVPESLAENPTHAAFTFSVPDSKGSLLEIVSRLSDAGLDLTDIDCHLASTESRRSFFVELKLGAQAHSTKFHEIMAELKEAYDINVLGVYQDRTTPDVHTAMIRTHKTDLALVHELWNGRSGGEIAQNSPVVYVEAKNTVGSLKGMLTAFRDNSINIVDMSRPYAPTGNGSRGFYFVLSPGTVADEVLAQLSADGYETQLCIHDGENLGSA
ncbi:MAG: prephenate dehydratase domain-containing protein [Candidatus Saccharimonadales bacterium]